MTLRGVSGCGIGGCGHATTQTNICVYYFLPGAEDLIGRTGGADHVMLMGITCGLSAPYVAGQIDYAMQQVCQPNTVDPLLG